MKRKHIFKVGDKVKLTDKETNETEIITIDETGFDDPYNGCDYFIERKDGYEWIYYIESRKKKRCFWYLYEERKYYKFEKVQQNKNMKKEEILKVGDKLKLTDIESKETKIVKIQLADFDNCYGDMDYIRCLEKDHDGNFIAHDCMIEDIEKGKCFENVHLERKYYKFEKMNDRTEKCMLDKHGLKVGDKIVLTPKPESFNLGYKEIEGTIKDIYVDKYDNTKNCFDVCDDFKDCQYTFVFNDLKGHECYQETGVCGDTKVEYTFKKISKIKEMKDNVKNLVDNALEVLQAYKDGKEIEVKGKENDKWTIFDDRAHTFFDFERCDYRIKEEEKYRPYKNAKEFNIDRGLNGGYFVDKQHGHHFSPIYFDDKVILCYKMLNDTTPMKEVITYENLFKYYTWDSGAVCGLYNVDFTKIINEDNRKA